MKIDIEKLETLVKMADRIFLGADGEEVLLQILEIEKQIEAAKTAVKTKLEEEALKLDENFSSIQGDKVKVYYRSYGSKYKIDESQIQNVPQELYKTKTTYLPDSKAIDEYAQKHNGLPLGVVEPERPKQLTFSEKNGEKDVE